MDNRQRKIENALIGMGITANLIGFYYSIEMTVGKMLYPSKTLQELYIEIGIGNHVSKGSVESAIIHAMKFIDIGSDAYKKYIGSSANQYPKQFFPLLAFNIRRELEDEQDNVSRTDKKRTDI